MDEKELFDRMMKLAIGKKKKNDAAASRVKDLHIRISIASKVTGLDIMALPLVMFRAILDDMEIITGKKEYDPKRNSKRLDSV